MRTNVHHLIESSLPENAQRPALTFKKTTLSYGDLWAQTQAVGAGLQSLALNRGDRVAVYLDKRIETVTSIFGTSAAGGAFVPVNPLLRAQQVGYILRDCGVRVLITSAERLALLSDELARSSALQHVILVDSGAAATDAATETARAAAVSLHHWAEVFADGAQPAASAAIDVDMAAILYTSGSTGSPKGVVLSHRNLIVGAESVSSYLQNSADDVILSALPLSFDAGFSQLTTGFSVGAHVILMNYLLPADVVRLCREHGVTGLTCVPPLWIQIAELSWPPEVAQRLRYFANTGGRMPKSTLTTLRSTFTEAKPYLMYGLTEAFRSTYLDPDEVERRPDSIGKAIPNAEILVLRADGSRCDAGEEGELVHRGALVALGYWNDPERTAARFKAVPQEDSSWRVPELAVWSGDTVVADAEGFLYFVGRQDDMIKTSGYRVSPSEIEELVYESGLVRDAVALGVEDPKLGQRVVLVVSPSASDGADSDALLSYLRHRLPLYMIPAQVIVKEELPTSPNGKFDRTLMKQQLTNQGVSA